MVCQRFVGYLKNNFLQSLKIGCSKNFASRFGFNKNKITKGKVFYYKMFQINASVINFDQGGSVDNHTALFQKIDHLGDLIGLCMDIPGNRRAIERLTGKGFTQKDTILARFKNIQFVLVGRYFYRGAFMSAEQLRPGDHEIVLSGMADGSFCGYRGLDFIEAVFHIFLHLPGGESQGNGLFR